MGLFDKLLKKTATSANHQADTLHRIGDTTLDAPATAQRTHAAAAWMDKYPDISLIGRGSQQADEPDPSVVRETIRPLLGISMEWTEIYYAMLAKDLSSVGQEGGVGIAACHCRKAIIARAPTISQARQFATKLKCPECGNLNTMTYLPASTSVCRQMRDLFYRHSVCLYNLQKAESLDPNLQAENVLSLCREAVEISQEIGNMVVMAKIGKGFLTIGSKFPMGPLRLQMSQLTGSLADKIERMI